MSRTIRRKGALYKRAYYITSLTEIQSWGGYIPPHARSAQQFQDQEKARFHRDHPSGRWNIQKWLRKECFRKVKLQSKNALRLSVQREGGEDFLAPVDNITNAQIIWLRR